MYKFVPFYVKIPYTTFNNLHNWRELVYRTHFIWKELLVPRWSRSWQRHAITKAKHSISPNIFHHWVAWKKIINQNFILTYCCRILSILTFIVWEKVAAGLKILGLKHLAAYYCIAEPPITLVPDNWVRYGLKIFKHSLQTPQLIGQTLYDSIIMKLQI